MPSSVIRAMQYAPEARELLIVFRGAGRGAYRYRNVPPETWLAFRCSESKGEYLNTFFKPQNFPYERAMVQPRGLVQDHQRAAEKDGQSQRNANLFEWGETWALPEPRSHARNASDSKQEDLDLLPSRHAA